MKFARADVFCRAKWQRFNHDRTTPKGRMKLRTLQGSAKRRGTHSRFLSVFSWLLLPSSALSGLACDATLGHKSEENAGSESLVIGEDDVPASTTRFRRLTHPQWRKTTVDLLGAADGSAVRSLIDGAIDQFRDDPVQGGYLFDGSGDSLDVDGLLWRSYQQTAAEVALAFVSDSNLLAAHGLDDSQDANAASTFITEFGAKVHRRPLTDAQIETYEAQYQAGTSAYADMPGFLGGIRLLVETFLQSPYFIYRVEQSDQRSGNMVPLDGYERASRMSYFFWGTMPDVELLAAARRGELDRADGVRAQATRLVEDPRASDAIVHFFDKLLDVEKYKNVSPSTTEFPDVGASFSDSLLGETRAFIEGEMFERNGGLVDFLTSNRGYVNSDLASIYGLDGTFGADFEAVDLDPTQRSGVFTQAGFLATNATSVDPDPIHRGVFLAKRINCITIAAPPDDIPPLPTPAGQSNRQLIEEHTEAEGTSCRNCHSTLINPFGFAYEHYDAIGAHRTMDGEHQVDASGEVFVDDQHTYVENAVDLAQLLARSPGVHECISSHLIAYAQGRNVVPEDEALIGDLGSASLEDNLSFKDLMIEMAAADSFLHRPEEEAE